MILDALRQVPVERWGEVLRFLQTLRAAEPDIRTARDLRASGLIGLWADREDLGNSLDFARRLRQQATRETLR
jgi:hypothetical protein